MKRRAVKIEYDGTNFRGWQLQPAVRTVQGELERAAGLAAGEEGRIVMHGAGRTDTGVHALAQVAHFESAAVHDPDTFMRAINYWLPEDISVTALREAGPQFHARFSVERKTYRYSIIISRTRRPLGERYSGRLPLAPDLEAMNACAETILGRHDFAAFTSSGGDPSDTVKHIFQSRWVPDGESLHYFVEGDGFTYNMVRTMVGSMLEAGGGKVTVDEFRAALESRERAQAGPTAPARGLMMMEVKYPAALDPFAA